MIPSFAYTTQGREGGKVGGNLLLLADVIVHVPWV
jgi:hypothetical protein